MIKSSQSSGFEIIIPCQLSFSAHHRNISCITFHPNSLQMASSSNDGSLKFWSLETGQYKHQLRRNTYPITYISYGKYGNYLLMCTDQFAITIVDTIQYTLVKTLFGHEHQISYAIFIENSEMIFSVSRDKTIRLWEVKTGINTRIYEGHDDWVRHIAVTKNERIFATCAGQCIKMWDINKDQPQMTLFGHQNISDTIIFAQNNEYLNKSYEQTKLSLYTINQKDKFLQQQTKSNPLFLISGSRDKTIRCYNCMNGDTLYTFEGHINWVRSLVLHSSGRYLYSVGDDSALIVWDLKQGKQINRINNAHDIFILAIRKSQLHSLLVTAGSDLKIKIWKIKQ